MPSETVLKVLIALNAVQLFITLLLVATLASAGLTARSGVADGASSQALSGSSGGGDPWAAADLEALPPEEGDAAVAASGLPQLPPEAPPSEDADRTRMILRTWLNLVSRRLELAASDAGVDASQWTPSDEAVDAAVASGDSGSEAFQAVLTTLKAGFDQLGLKVPDPPASSSAEGK